jgi:hypothetical protein
MTHQLRTWCKSRQVVSTAIGLVVVGPLICGIGYQILLPITLNSGHGQWFLSAPALGGLGLALLASLNSLPAVPEWEVPLQRRTRIAHAATWGTLVMLGAGGPAVAVVRLPDTDHQYIPTSILAFYLLCAAVCGAAIHTAGRTLGTSLALVVIAGAVAIEQATGTRWPLPDLRTNPSWVVCCLGLLVALYTAYRTAGHPPRFRR